MLYAVNYTAWRLTTEGQSIVRARRTRFEKRRSEERGSSKMPRRRKKSAATTPADANAGPAVLPPPDQNSDQIASIKVSGVGRTRTLELVDDTPDSFSRLMAAFGTEDLDFFGGLIEQIAGVRSREDQPASLTVGFLLSVVKNTRPRDELEAMLLAQIATCHMIAMDTASRLNNPEEYRLLLKVMKTYADLKQTFDRGRKAGEQSCMVQNMTVKDGGQAIVGNVMQKSAQPKEGKTAAPSPTEAGEIPLARINESPELAPGSPVAKQQEEETRAFGNKDGQ